jgi:putative transposase
VIKAVRALALGVSRKNIYRDQAKQSQKDAGLRDQINKLHLKHPSYGHKRLSMELLINKKRIRRVMKLYGIKPPRRKKSFYTTISTSHHHYTNLIKDLVINKPHQVWCADLSYIKFQGKFLYLATIIDIATRQVIAVQIGHKHDSSLVLSTIKQAVAKAQTHPLIFHTDQGAEFMATTCTDYLEKRDTKISVSDKASPWQNGYQESFFGKFKDESGDFNRYDTVGELAEAIYSQVHYYNYERIHTALKMPPAMFAKSLADTCLHVWGT